MNRGKGSSVDWINRPQQRFETMSFRDGPLWHETTRLGFWNSMVDSN